MAVAVPLRSDAGSVDNGAMTGAGAGVGAAVAVAEAAVEDKRWSHIMTILIFGSQFLIALCVDSVAVIWSIVGSTVSIMIAYIVR